MTTRPGGTAFRCPRCAFAGSAVSPARAAFRLRQHSCDRQLRLAATRARAGRRATDERPARPCTHPDTPHQCGTAAKYAADQCRCQRCTTAHRDAEDHRRRQLAYGRWEPYVAAGPVRDHVRALLAQGMGVRTVFRSAGLDPARAGKLLYGIGGRPPAQRCRRSTADALLAVRLDLAGGQRIDATGTRRRLQALVAVGHHPHRVADELGVARTTVRRWLRGQVRMVTVAAAARVAAFYDRAWCPRADQVDPQALAWARAHGWAVPAAWDEEDLDDPAARPAPAGPGGSARGAGAAELAENLGFLLTTGASWAEAASRLGVSESYLRYTLPSRTRQRSCTGCVHPASDSAHADSAHADSAHADSAHAHADAATTAA